MSYLSKYLATYVGLVAAVSIAAIWVGPLAGLNWLIPGPVAWLAGKWFARDHRRVPLHSERARFATRAAAAGALLWFVATLVRFSLAAWLNGEGLAMPTVQPSPAVLAVILIQAAWAWPMVYFGLSLGPNFSQKARTRRAEIFGSEN